LFSRIRFLSKKIAEIGCNTHKIIKLKTTIEPIIGIKKDQTEIPADLAAAISKLLLNLVKVNIDPNKKTKGRKEKTKNGIL